MDGVIILKIELTWNRLITYYGMGSFIYIINFWFCNYYFQDFFIFRQFYGLYKFSFDKKLYPFNRNWIQSPLTGQKN